MLHPGEVPGRGVDLDQALAAEYPCDPRQLLIARLRDGTMFNW